METSLPKFSRAAQKILVAQNLGGAAAPLAPPARTPMPTEQFIAAVQRTQFWDMSM